MSDYMQDITLYKVFKKMYYWTHSKKKARNRGCAKRVYKKNLIITKKTKRKKEEEIKTVFGVN